MPRMDQIGTVATTVQTDDGVTTVVYHSTAVVMWVQKEDLVILNSGGWQTVTTKNRMNQAAYQFGLPFTVWQKDYAWFVTVRYADGSEKDMPFKDGMSIEW
jgi:hypothetical protein